MLAALKFTRSLRRRARVRASEHGRSIFHLLVSQQNGFDIRDGDVQDKRSMAQTSAIIVSR